MAIKFKAQTEEKEFYQLPIHNSRMSLLLRALDAFCELELKKPVIITEIYRTPEENKAQGGIPNSPHLTWEGVDIRSSVFTDAEIERIKNFLNQFTFRNGKQVAVYHAVPGGAFHFHIQYAK
jgi:hypothetical protein